MHLSFQFFAWVACVMFAVEAIAVKAISNHQIKNPWLLNALWTLIVCVLNIIVCLLAGAGIPKDWFDIVWAGVFFALSTSFFVFANARLDLSTLSPLFNFRTIFVVALGTLFLGEVITVTQMIIIVIMVLGGICVSLDEKFSPKSFFTFGVLLAMADMLALAFMALFLKKSLAADEFWTVNLWYYLFGTVCLIPTVPFFYKEIKTLSKFHFGGIILTSVAGVVGNFAASKAYASNIGISGAIISIPLSVIIVMLIAPFYPKLLEHHTAKVYVIRIVAAVVLVLAALKLT